ncbi:MAG: ABC transporter substrate-binding protein [Dehalococcoidia bacterium]|nr:ABC transporter substrate-binding protein [Dehalococcoidia bacterium]
MNREDNYWLRRSSRPITRRRWIGGAFATGAGLAAASTVGCGDDDDDATDSTATTGTTSTATQAGNPSPTAVTEKPTRGGVWRAVMPGDPTNLDPYAGTSFTTTQIGAWVYSTLFRQKAGPGVDPGLYALEPDIAESYTASEDGLTYTVKLKSNAKFHAPLNRPVDADDVVFSWRRYTGQIEGTPANANAVTLNDYLGSVEKVDASTVVFKLKKTRGDFLSTNGFIFIMPKETGTAFDPATKMVGTGPWVFDSYQPGTVVKFKRNNDWHLGPDAPYFDSVEVNLITEYNTRLTQFLAGNLDEVDILGSDLERAQGTVKGLQLFVGQSNLPASYITFDGSPAAANAPWRDPRVRKAVSMALDRDAMLDAAYNLKDIEKLNLGAKRRWNNDMPAFESGYWLDPTGKFQIQASDPKISAENAKSFAYNPADAKKLLEAAGHKDGFKSKLHTTTSRYGLAFNTITELIQQYLGQIGVDLELVDEDYNSVYVTKTARGEFDGLAHIPRGGGTGSQFEIYYLPGGIRNNAKIEDAKLADDVRAMLAERDREKQRVGMLNLQNYVNDKMYLVPSQLGASGVYTGYAANVRNGLQYQVNGYYQGSCTVPYYFKA